MCKITDSHKLIKHHTSIHHDCIHVNIGSLSQDKLKLYVLFCSVFHQIPVSLHKMVSDRIMNIVKGKDPDMITGLQILLCISSPYTFCLFNRRLCDHFGRTPSLRNKDELVLLRLSSSQGQHTARE